MGTAGRHFGWTQLAVAVAVTWLGGAMAALVRTGALALTARPSAPAVSWADPVYRAGDFGGGMVRSILPAGENGLVNATELAAFEATGARPPGSQDQLGRYANLRWNTPSLTTGPKSRMAGAEQVQYTFNWFYVDDRHIAYYQSGLDPAHR